MWRASSGDSSSRRHGARHVRFVEDNEDQHVANVSAPAANNYNSKARGRIHRPSAPLRTTRGHSKSRRPWYSLTTGTAIKEQQRQTTMQMAADEIERLLLDEANTGNADQMVDTTDDDYNDDYSDDYDQEYQTIRIPVHLAQQENARDSSNGTTGTASLSASHYNPSPIQTQAASHWPLRRRRSLPTLSRRARYSTYPQGNAPQSCDRPTSPTRNGGTTLVQMASDELTEQDVNAYGLFDSAGADEARLRYQRHLQLQLQRRQQERGGGSSCANTSLLHTFVGASLFPDDPTQTSGVIYDQKKYGPSIPFFTPILLALTTIFCVLVVVRLMVSLLTLAVGWLVVILLTLRLMHQILHRPVHLIRLVHARPLLSWVFIGALAGMAQVCCTRIALLLHIFTNLQLQLPLQLQLDSHLQEQWVDNEQPHMNHPAMEPPSVQCFESPHYPFDSLQSLSFPFDHEMGEQVLATQLQDGPSVLWNMTLLYTNFSNAFSMEQDLVLIWGMLEGIVYGLQVGILWHLLLGSSLHPSKLSLWIYTNIWCFARSHYRECIRHRQQAHLLQTLRRRQQQELLGRRLSNSQLSSSLPITTTRTDNDKKQCMICLEEFTFTTNNSNINDDDNEHAPVSSLYRRHYLHCHHSFHFCCIQQWLEIKQSCPVCRISLLDTTTASTDRSQQLLFLSTQSSADLHRPNATPTSTGTG